MLNRIAKSLSRRQKRTIILFIDIVLISFSHLLACWLFLGFGLMFAHVEAVAAGLAVVVAVGATLTVRLGLHWVKLNAYQMQGVVETALVAAMMTGAGVFVSALIPKLALPAQLYIVSGMLFLILAVSTRLVLRQLLLLIYRKGSSRLPILIYGAGQTGQQLATALTVDDAVEPVAFIDDDLRLQNVTIAGLRVYPSDRVEDLVRRFDVRRIVLAMPSAKRSVQTTITRRLAELHCEVHILPSFAELVAHNAETLSDTKPVNINDLLGRDRLEEELPGVSETYQKRNILVTGAGGTIGSELCRQLVACKPDCLVMLDHSEFALFEITRELETLAPDLRIVPVLGSVCEKRVVRDAITANEVDIVLHAAAYKHVPLVEANALEAGSPESPSHAMM